MRGEPLDGDGESVFGIRRKATPGSGSHSNAAQMGIAPIAGVIRHPRAFSPLPPAADAGGDGLFAIDALPITQYDGKTYG